MPELPEVELYGRYLSRHALGQRIRRVRVGDERVLGAVTPARLQRALRGEAFRAVHRHGKHLFAAAGERWLHLHFGMTGDLVYYAAGEQPPRFARVEFEFAGGHRLAFDDPRLFGVVELVPSPEAYVLDRGLGPDALDATDRLGDFRARMAKKRGAVKPLLMSQTVVAGLGNLYVDEVLYQTSIGPLRPAEKLSAPEVAAIFRTSRRILQNVIRRKERGLDYPAHYLASYREEGERCKVCGGTIRRATVGGRTTYFCGRHQR